jgi:hypothetical protein
VALPVVEGPRPPQVHRQCRVHLRFPVVRLPLPLLDKVVGRREVVPLQAREALHRWT